MKILSIDCYAGIAGDMMVGALLDLGVPFDHLKDSLSCLPLPASAYSLTLSNVKRHGFAAKKFSVRVEEHQPHRHYSDIAALIEGSSLAPSVKETAQKIFFRLAEAEAKVHGVEIGHVHFHEVGAIDSIIDIVGTAICLHYLHPDQIVGKAVPLGSGYVESAHGKLPIPAPATLELLRGIPVHSELGAGERVTPTGAAILGTLVTSFAPAPTMTIRGTGFGAGDRDFSDIANLLRVTLGEVTDRPATDEVTVVETHIDDMNPELLGHLMERLLQAGALDVAYSAIQMKKNRPAVRITVLARPEDYQELARIMLLESTAIGLRHYPASRTKLQRTAETRETSLGSVKVKVMRDVHRVVRVAPEYEECRRIARERDMTLMDVYRIVEKEVTP